MQLALISLSLLLGPHLYTRLAMTQDKPARAYFAVLNNRTEAQRHKIN